jgi:phosphoenolpyruvate phosphomutase / 2-hydroxyethylphosphonate cytidylyltransferase
MDRHRKSVTPGTRLAALRRLLDEKKTVRLIDAHNGLSGLIGDRARTTVGGVTRDFDALWESSFTDSASKGLPDASIVGFDSRLHTINEILHVTTKPLVVDGDTGGEAHQLRNLVRQLERLGVSAVVIEDKVYPKRNSLDPAAVHELEDPEVFAGKIVAGKRAALTGDFMIVARVESLIAQAGMNDALLRAERYIQAGVDGIMIHSRQQDGGEVLAFAESYEALCRRLGRRPALGCVPTTYNHLSEDELARRGFNIIIYANHLMRACYRVMSMVADRILATGGSRAVDDLCSPVHEVLAATGHDLLADDEDRS